ncbi:peptidoglycan-binding protein [Ignatzschineria rhizosphaerae]|uniref:Peptidoglycan-binding protein n=1 Tax=Ignatzschineria rhizosphaerae TaxID=2923279 RepID=A0ABY3X5U6_9GAMM|nr:peptidoglycan-binding protein [Ignatzschineria rhizosphaerae]UNM96121.1 peptidoglycan-binding protein [Ignatzschineria rhizosphaerae]
MRKAILKVALSSILALSLGSANSLIDIIKDSQNPEVQSLVQYQNDKNLYFKDAYGFTLIDYVYAKNNPELVKWLESQNIQSGVTPALIQRAQIWLFLLNYPVDNLEGNFTRAFQEDILNYQRKNNLTEIAQITPEWFIDLEHDAITSLLTDIEKANPTLSEAALQLELINTLQERLPSSVELNQLLTTNNILNATNHKVLFEIIPQDQKQTPYEMLLELDFLDKTPQNTELKALPESLMTYFDFTADEIQNITKNPRSQKTLTLQTWLRIAGYFPPPLVIDGINGANSRNAIKRYQTDIGQPADGIPHVRWEEPLETLIRTKAQQQLHQLEFYTRAIHGRNDAATRNAIRRFEKSVGLPETGTLAPSVLFHLFNANFLPKEAIITPDVTITPIDSISNAAAPTQEVAITEENTSQNKDVTGNLEDETLIEENSKAQHHFVLTPIVQETLTLVIKQQKEAQEQAKIEAEIAAKKAEEEAKKAEFTAKLKALAELEEPIQLFSLSRAEVDQLIINARRSDIFFTQVALHLLNLYDGDIDGANGPATRDAIRRFEKALGQRETGEILPRWQTPLRQMMYRMVQYRLTQDGFYEGDIDGITGPGTRNAIIAYEKANHTEEVGRLTPALLLTLFNTDLNRSIDSSIDPEEIPTDSPEDVTNDGTAPVSAEEDRELQADSNKNDEQYRSSVKDLDLSHAKSTEEIALIQLQLAYLGFYTGTIDGLTGPVSTRAITAFQKAFELPTSGKLDKRTQEKLEIENINKFQRYLQRTGYMKDAATGTMGPKSRRAVGILKNRYGYNVNEALDIPAYLILIDEEQGTTIAKEYYDKVIKAREEEEAIKDTQSYLIGFGILNDKVDGKIGPATERAISAYRSQQGLSKGNQIDDALLESFKKGTPKQAQSYLQQLGYPVKPDGIFGNNSKKQLNVFLKSQNKPASDIVTATILMDLKIALDARLASRSSANSNVATPRKTGTAPQLQKGLQEESVILSNAPSSTVNGSLQVIKNNSGAVVGCKVRNITMAADWCSGKKNGSSCRVLYKNGRVLSMNCR